MEFEPLDQIIDRLRGTKEQPEAAIERGQLVTFTGIDGSPETICHAMESMFIDALSHGCIVSPESTPANNPIVISASETAA